jgi:hypothetical protein
LRSIFAPKKVILSKASDFSEPKNRSSTETTGIFFENLLFTAYRNQFSAAGSGPHAQKSALDGCDSVAGARGYTSVVHRYVVDKRPTRGPNMRLQIMGFLRPLQARNLDHPVANSSSNYFQRYDQVPPLTPPLRWSSDFRREWLYTQTDGGAKRPKYCRYREERLDL